MTIEVSVSAARADFSELINKVGYGGERVVITRHGKPLVALVAAEDAAAMWAERDPSPVAVLDVGSRAASVEFRSGAAAEHHDDPQAKQ
jgi:prevent-host-death family protein